MCAVAGLIFLLVEHYCGTAGKYHRLTNVESRDMLAITQGTRCHVVLQILALVFYLPLLSAYFDEPASWYTLSCFDNQL